MQEIVNLTPHPLNIVDEEGNVILSRDGCQNPPRLQEERTHTGYLVGVPTFKVRLGKIENLPEPNGDTIFVVSRPVAEASRDRDDLFIPDQLVRDEKGSVIGAKGLAQL